MHPRKKTTAVVKSWSTRLTEKCYILCYIKTLNDCQLCENKSDMSIGSQSSPSAIKLGKSSVCKLSTRKSTLKRLFRVSFYPLRRHARPILEFLVQSSLI